MLCASVLLLLLLQGCYGYVARLLPRCCQAAPSLLPSSRARCYVHLPRPSGATPVESEASRDALGLRLSNLMRPGTLESYACRV